MGNAFSHWAARVLTIGVVPCALFLAGAVALLTLFVLPIVLWWQGTAGLQPMFLAAAVSLLIGLCVLAVSHQASLRSRPLVAMLIAMTLRMIPLLVFGIIVAGASNRSDYLPFLGYLSLYYFATLAVETFVSVQLAQLPVDLTSNSREQRA